MDTGFSKLAYGIRDLTIRLNDVYASVCVLGVCVGCVCWVCVLGVCVGCVCWVCVLGVCVGCVCSVI